MHQHSTPPNANPSTAVKTSPQSACSHLWPPPEPTHDLRAYTSPATIVKFSEYAARLPPPPRLTLQLSLRPAHQTGARPHTATMPQLLRLLSLSLGALAASAAGSEVYVYTPGGQFSHSSQSASSSSSSPPSKHISPQVASLVLSHRLGVDKFYRIEESDAETAIPLLAEFGSPADDGSVVSRVLVVVDGADDPRSMNFFACSRNESSSVVQLKLG